MPLIIAFFSGVHYQWYDIVLMALAAAIVFPERTLEWLSKLTGKPIWAQSLVTLEAVAIASVVLFSIFLIAISATGFVWWAPLAIVIALAGVRFIRTAIIELLGLDE